MNSETKKYIQQRINETAVSYIGEVQPEFFLTERTGNIEVKQFECTKHQVVHLQISFIGGKLFHIMDYPTCN